MKPFEYYQTTQHTYPDKAQHTTVYAYSKGSLQWQGTLNEYKKLIEKDYDKLTLWVTETILDKEAYNKQIKDYNNELRALEEEFKQDLFKEFDVENNPKRERCYNLAYEEGHAYGLSTVYAKFEDFVELIKE